jgi:hypothetical protein
VYVRFRSPSLLSSRQSMDVDAIPDERRQRQNLRMYFCLQCSWLQAHAIGGQEDGNGLHTFGAEAISLLWRLATFGVRKGGQDLFVETRKRKVSSKCRPNETNPPTIQPTKPTNQSKTKLRAQGGAKNLLKRRQVRKPFSQA